MARTISTNLQNILNLSACETQTTLDLIPVTGSPKYFATAGFTHAGKTYTPDLRSMSELRQSVFGSPDRVEVSIQNVDKLFGIDLLSTTESLAFAEAILGRYYIAPGFTSEWMELFRGTVFPIEVNESEARLEILQDLTAAGYCVSDWSLAPNCQVKFKGPVCGYAGGLTTCNKRLKSNSGCLGRENEHRFVGMEFPDVQVSTPPTGGDGGGGGWGGGGSGSCFIGSTPVTIHDGYKVEFEEIFRRRGIFIGSPIKSFDDLGNVVTDQIEEVFRHFVYDYLEVKFSSDPEPMGITKEHPFWTAWREFVPVGKLAEGDRVHEHRFDKWRWPEIEYIRPVQVPEGIWVYNLTTRRYHRYLANDKAVHNSKPIILE